jgi:hypothetical protein
MSPESNKPSSKPNADQQNDADIEAVDPRDLVYHGTPTESRREIIENPAVTPERLDDQPEDLRSDLLADNEL